MTRSRFCKKFKVKTEALGGGADVDIFTFVFSICPGNSKERWDFQLLQKRSMRNACVGEQTLSCRNGMLFVCSK